MKQWNSFLIAWTAVIALFWCSSALSFVTYESFKPQLLETHFNANYFSSTANYASSGSAALSNGNSLTQFDLSGRGRYVANRRWALLGGAILSSSKSQGLDNSGRTTTRTNTSLNKISVGAQYFLGFYAKNEFYPEVVLHYPLEKVDTDINADTVPNSEGVYHLSALMKTQRHMKSWRMFGNAGLGLRGQGRSTLLEYGLGFDWPQKTYLYGGEVFGYETVIKDSESNNAGSGDAARDRNVFINRVLGGSQKYESYNPSLTNISAFIKFGYKPWMNFGFGAGTSLRGANSANGYFIEAMLSLSFDRKSKLDMIKERSKTKGEFIEIQQEAKDDGARFQEDVSKKVPPNYGRPQIKSTPSPQTPTYVPRYVFPKSTSQKQRAVSPIRKSAPRIAPKVRPATKPTVQLKKLQPQKKRQITIKHVYTEPMKKQTTTLPAYPTPEIQNQLDDTEMQINLKQDRRRR